MGYGEDGVELRDSTSPTIGIKNLYISSRKKHTKFYAGIDILAVVTNKYREAVCRGRRLSYCFL